MTDYGSGNFGRCKLFPKDNIDNSMLVTGVKETKEIEYSYCSTARSFEYMCGQKGKLYKKKYTKRDPIDFMFPSIGPFRGDQYF